jgi:hypothetical protein
VGNMGQVKKEKCSKCKTRDATKEDGLCDSCSFLALLTKISKKQ